MGWGKVGYMGLGKDEDMMVNPCLPITAALRSLSPPGSVGPRGLSRTEPEWVEKCGPKEMQRLDWSLSRKVTQDIKTQPQINHYQSISKDPEFLIMKIREKREKISEKKSGFFGSVRHSLGSSFMSHSVRRALA